MSALVRVHPDEVRAEPGSVVELDVLVTNLSPAVERYRFEVMGMPGGAFFDPGEVSLLPDQDGRATGHLTVSIDAPLGEVRAAIRAVGEMSGSVDAADFGLLVGERPDVEVALRPPTSHGYRSGKHSLWLTNNGTLPTSVELAAVGETDAVTVRVPPTANIDTGQSREVPVVVKTRRRPERGERFPFTVSVHHGAQTTVLPGLLQCGPRPLKHWLIAGSAALLALLLIAFVLFRGGDGGESDLAAGESPETTRLFLDTGVTTIPTTFPEVTTVPPPSTTAVVTFPAPVVPSVPVLPGSFVPPQTSPTQPPTTQAPTTTIPRPATKVALARELYDAWIANNEVRMRQLADGPAVVDPMRTHPKRLHQAVIEDPVDCEPEAQGCQKIRYSGCVDGSPDGVEWVEVTGADAASFRAVRWDPCPSG